MKKYMWCLIALVLTAQAFGEIIMVEKDLDIEVTNNSLFIKSDGLDWDRQLEFSDNYTLVNFERELTISWVENLSCSTELNLVEIESQLSDVQGTVNNISSIVGEIYSGSMDYYQLYTESYADLERCREYQQNNEEHKARADDCEKSLQQTQTTSSAATSQKKQYKTSMDECVAELTDIKSQRTFAFVWAFIATIYGLYAYIKYVRKIDKKKEAPYQEETRGMEPK